MAHPAPTNRIAWSVHVWEANLKHRNWKIIFSTKISFSCSKPIFSTKNDFWVDIIFSKFWPSYFKNQQKFQFFQNFIFLLKTDFFNKIMIFECKWIFAEIFTIRGGKILKISIFIISFSCSTPIFFNEEWFLSENNWKLVLSEKCSSLKNHHFVRLTRSQKPEMPYSRIGQRGGIMPFLHFSDRDVISQTTGCWRLAGSLVNSDLDHSASLYQFSCPYFQNCLTSGERHPLVENQTFLPRGMSPTKLVNMRQWGIRSDATSSSSHQAQT